MSRRARRPGRIHNKDMGIARILGIAVAVAAIATLCLLSTTTATIVAATTVIAVALDGFRQRDRSAARETAVMIDLSTRDYVEGIDR